MVEDYLFTLRVSINFVREPNDPGTPSATVRLSTFSSTGPSVCRRNSKSWKNEGPSGVFH